MSDDMGGSSNVTGQMTYDMFDQPLGDHLDGTIDPVTGLNAARITQQAQGITGMIVTCPKYEADGVTLSPLAGQAVVSNLVPGQVQHPGHSRCRSNRSWRAVDQTDAAR